MKLTARSIKIFLKARGVDLEESDDHLIINYVDCVKDLQDLRQALDDEGLLLDSDSPRGDLKKVKNPAFDMLSTRLKDLGALAGHLGLSPRSRKELLKGVETVKKSAFPLVRNIK